MGDTLDDPPSNAREPRRDKPQTLAGIHSTKNLSSNTCSTHLKHSSASFSHLTTSSASSSSHTSHAYVETITSSSTSDDADLTRLARSRARSSASGSDEREHSCDISSGRSNVRATASGGGCGGNDVEFGSTADSTSRRESLNCDDTSPSGTHFGKSLFGRPSRYPSSGGATTRKCVLTLDGYSYVIVASTPENRPTRDDSTGSCGIGGGSSSLTTSAGNLNERRTSSTASSSCTAASNERSNSPTGHSSIVGGFVPGSGSSGSSSVAVTAGGSAASLTHSEALNGQVARHGSLTIVRRSNSRKNFAQLDSQQTILSPSAAATNAVGTAGAFDTPTTPLNDPSAATPTTTTAPEATTAASYDYRTKDYSSSYLAETENTPHLHKTFSTSTNTTCNNSSLAGATATAATEQHLHYMSRMQTGSTTATSTTTNSNSSSNNSTTAADRMSPTTNEGAPTTTAKGAGDGDDLNAAGTNNSPITPITMASCPVDLATENLPAVDTPDACDKAAVRLRCLLRLLGNGEISPEILQKNLHYAARVLEAVFLDETKRPTNNSHQSGQNMPTSEDGEDPPDDSGDKSGERCNGNCKNLNCSQHSHETHHCSSSSNVQNNNNANSSCSLQQNDNQQQQSNNMASHNQTTCIEGRTKGVSLAPQTHSGPTGPPDTVTTDCTGDNVESSTTVAAAVGGAETSLIGSSSGAHSGGGDGNRNIGSSSSSNSNKATVQRQRRLRTPVWARSMSTNKTYSFPNMVFLFKI